MFTQGKVNREAGREGESNIEMEESREIGPFGNVQHRSRAYFKEYPWTPFIIARAQNAMKLYALRAVTPEYPFQRWPLKEQVDCSRPSTSLNTPCHTPL
jgi:hypothetical protein